MREIATLKTSSGWKEAFLAYLPHTKWGDLGGPHFCLLNHLGLSLAPGIEAMRQLIRRVPVPLATRGEDNKNENNTKFTGWKTESLSLPLNSLSPSLENLPRCLLFRFLNAWVHAKSLQLCPTLCNPMSSNPPGSSVHGILQARILEWGAFSFSRGSSRLRAQNHVS